VLVRIGIHTGEPLLTEAGYYVGVDLSRAARICAAAYGGQVLLSASTHGLVSDVVETRDLGEHVLKDIDAPERLYQLVAPGLRDRFPPPRAAAPGNLPRRRTTFFGRRRELDDLLRLLGADAPVVTISGPGGVGKTRLAIEVARQAAPLFADGAFFVSLASTSAADVPLALAETLEVDEQSGASIVDSLHRHLRSRSMLLVLDNFESALDAAPEIGGLVNDCAGVKVLATSRERLHLDGEHEYRLEPLDARDARDLFVSRALASRPDLDVERERDDVDAICRQLDRLPLALELAAARVRVLPLPAILDRLGERLSFLTGGARDLPERQRTLAATLEWSYALLDDEEREALQLLAVFVGGASLDATERVVAPQAGALDVVTSLCDKSLAFSRIDNSGSPRFTMLATIREYALAQLVERGGLADARRRHAAYFLGLAEAAEPDVQGPRQAVVLRLLATEHDNLRAALAWAAESGEEEMLARLAAALWRFWFVRGHLSEGRQWLPRALESDTVSDGTRARVLHGAATLDAVAGDLASARRWAEERLAVCGRLGDEAQTASALVGLANIDSTAGDRDAAAARYEQAATHARRAGSRAELASVMSNIGYLALLRGDLVAARTTCREAAALFEELGFLEDAAGAWLNDATAELLSHDLDRARAALARGLDGYIELQHTDGISYCLEVAAALGHEAGDPYRAAVLASAAACARRHTGASLPPMEQRLRDEVLAKVAAALDGESLASAEAEGAALDLQAAIAATRSHTLAPR
jgi:predicted ATPase